MPVKNHAAACSALCWCQHKQNWKLLMLNAIFQVWVLWGFWLGQFSSRWMPCICSLHPAVAWGTRSSTHLEAGLLLWAVAQRESCRGWLWKSWAPPGEFPCQILDSSTCRAHSSATPLHTVTAAHTRSARSSQRNTQHLILEAAGGCEKPSLQSEIVLTYWKISFSSKLCMFAPVLCSMSVFLFSRSTTPPAPVAGLVLSRLFLTFSCLWWIWQSYSEAHLETTSSHIMGGFFCHGEKWGKMIYTHASFHRVFHIIAKLFPNPPSPSLCPSQRLHVQAPLHWWSNGGNLWNVARTNAGWQLKMVPVQALPIHFKWLSFLLPDCRRVLCLPVTDKRRSLICKRTTTRLLQKQ